MKDPENEPQTHPESEIRLKARAVSRGISIGRIVCLHGLSRQFYRVAIDPSEVESEVRRLRKAVATAKRQLIQLANRKSGRIAESGPGIFDAHRLLIEDPQLQQKFENEIAERHVNAEWAIKHVTDGYIAKYKAIPDEHLRDRYIDIDDVSERILVALGGGRHAKLPYASDSVIAAKELTPSTLVELADALPRAIVTENGGWTSHTFILAREMSRPAVTGVKKILRRVKTGDQVIVDGYNGLVILHPSAETLSQYSAEAARFDGRADVEDRDTGDALKTLDGRGVRILANSDTAPAYLKAKNLGARGIGLYRSEFLFNRFHGFPSENEQTQAYRSIANAAGEDGVKIRTFDIGADQLLDQNAAREKNPALGLRAIRLGLGYKRTLRTQLRALLRASHGANLDIVIPMVSGLSEIRSVREIIVRESSALRSKGIDIGSPRVGAMIEIPAAVMMIDELMDEADFVCLGTNDLIQYLVAADRDNESVSGWYRTLHPAVLRAVGKVLKAAAHAGKSAIVCGEMAGSPYYVPVLIGLGATELSMNVHSVPKVRRIVSGIAAEEARALVAEIEPCRTVEEVEQIVADRISRNWAHLFPQNFSFTS